MRFSQLLVLSACAVPVTVFAADQDTPGGYDTRPHIIINATRTPTPVSDIASSVTVIDREQIERENRATVSDLLRDAPGITVAGNGGPGQPTRLFMRGTNSNHVLVVMDGVRINDPSDPGDAFDLSNLTTDMVERIEILRGPQSTLYGSQALGGVINIVTRKGKGAFSANALSEVGRYGSKRVSAGASGELGKTSYSLQGGYYGLKGISSFDRKYGGQEKDGSDIYTMGGNLATRFTDAFTGKLSARYNQTVAEFDSPGGFTRPNDDPYPENDSKQVNVRASGELKLLDGFWTQELGASTLYLNRAQITEYFDSFGTPFFGRQQNFGRRNSVDWLHHLNWKHEMTTTLGAEIWRDYFKTLTLAEQDAGTKAIFADHRMRLTKEAFIGASARMDYHQNFGKRFTWKIAPGYDIFSTGTTLKASYGTSFKAPSLSQLFDPGYGNANLNPESAKGYEAGIEQRLMNERLTLSATAFRNDIEQLLSFDSSPPFKAINIGKARTQGIESGVEFAATPTLRLRASHVYTQTEDRTKNNQLARRPKHQFTAGADYDATHDLKLGANLRYSGTRKDIDFNFPYGRVDVKPATVLDLSAEYAVNAHASVYARLENVTDKRYEEVYGYGQPGRGLYVGVKGRY